MGLDLTKLHLKAFEKAHVRSDPFFVDVVLIFGDLDDQSEAPGLGSHCVASHAGLHCRVGPCHVDLANSNVELACNMRGSLDDKMQASSERVPNRLIVSFTRW